MTFDIPARVIDAGVEAYEKHDRIVGGEVEMGIEDAIQACLKEWGAQREREILRLLPKNEVRERGRVRLVFPWEPEGDES